MEKIDAKTLDKMLNQFIYSTDIFERNTAKKYLDDFMEQYNSAEEGSFEKTAATIYITLQKKIGILEDRLRKNEYSRDAMRRIW
ncbi:Uncharacterised protein [Candidatus Tiddalikarchaeum anstoanum]|nr:Uncharacterised protein [Candidatus Tiddalikarchaeum anstoanum]